MLAAAGSPAWKAVSKHATSGSPRSRRPHRGQRGERLRLVQRRQRGQLLQGAGDLVVDHRRRAEALAAVHDPVAGRVGVTERVERGADVVAGRQVARAEQLVAVAEQPQLEAARAGVDDQDAHPRQSPGSLQSRTSGGSSPCARVYARTRRRSSTISWRSPAARCAEAGHPVDHVHDEVVAVHVVEHDHVERRRGRALLLVAAHVQVAVVRPPVGQPVDQPRVAVVGEDHRPVGGEERVELRVGEPVRVLVLVLQPHQVDDVDEADAQVGQPLAQDRRGGQRLERRDVAGAAEHDVGILAVVVARPLPDAEAARAVRDRLVHRQVVERRLLAGHDHVDVVAAAQAVVADRQQAVRVRRQVDADDLGLLVDHVVDEARVLVREAVVVLAPDVRGEQVVERGDRPAPRDRARHLQPLRVLVEHRVDDVDERLVAVEEAVPAGQQVALQPALAEVLAEHLHHAPVGREVVVARLDLRHPRAVGLLEHGAEPVRGGLVGAEDAEVRGVLVAAHDLAQVDAEHARRLARRLRRRGDVDRVVAEVRQAEVAQQRAAVGVRVRAHAALAGGRRREQLVATGARPRRTAPPACTSASTPRAGAGARGSAPGRRAAPGASATCPPPACRRPPSGRSSPSASAARSSASAAARSRSPARAARWISAISSSAPSSVGRQRLVDRVGIVALDEARRVAVALAAASAARPRGCARARSGWRSCSR